MPDKCQNRGEQGAECGQKALSASQYRARAPDSGMRHLSTPEHRAALAAIRDPLSGHGQYLSGSVGLPSSRVP